MALSVIDIVNDELTLLSLEHWGTEEARKKPFNNKIVEKLFESELNQSCISPSNLRRVVLLELSRYLEHYLIPHWNVDSSSNSHFLSIIILLNEKFREKVSDPFGKPKQKQKQKENESLSLSNAPGKTIRETHGKDSRC